TAAFAPTPPPILLVSWKSLSIQPKEHRHNPSRYVRNTKVNKRRVFASAKMSVCILVAKKMKNTRKTEFGLRMNNTPSVDVGAPPTRISLGDLEQFDPNGLSIPLVTEKDIQMLRTIYAACRRLGEVGTCYTGEVDLSLDREFIKEQGKYATLLKGAIIGRYEMRASMSQGQIEFLDSKAFLARKGQRRNAKAWHHQSERIVLQGITGINETVRLKMAIAPKGAFCANSANYILLKSEDSVFARFVLGVLNSAPVNHVFKCFSTNSNVNGYEVDNLPIPKANPSEQGTIAALVDRCLAKSGRECGEQLREIDERVKAMFGIA
ncbi:MAG: hypothetical protein NT031_08985, partial [Planctomycetota bacterium]|nr:hypothetical protein [Planctomycetota bacterium]